MRSELYSEILLDLSASKAKYTYPEIPPFNPYRKKFIVVGDNPGRKEFEQGKYFIGPSGMELKNQFETLGLTEDFYEECLIRNKTFLHTNKTNELEEVRHAIGEDLFNKTQIICAFEIAAYANKYHYPVLVFGKGHLAPGKLFAPFWNALLEYMDDVNNIYVFNHPAPPHFQFREEWQRYRGIYKDLSNIDLLKKIGSVNRSKIMDRFKTITPKGGFRFFYGEHVYHQNGRETWPKLFVLSEDGVLYSEYLNFGKTAISSEKVNYATFNPKNYRWGGYQSLRELSREEAKAVRLIRQPNWIGSYLSKKGG